MRGQRNIQPRQVLILASPDDVHALSVRHHVEDLGGHGLIVDARAIAEGTLTGSQEESFYDVSLGDDQAAIGGDCSIWWRRARPPAAPPGLRSSGTDQFIRAEWRAALFPLLARSGARLVNDPFHEERASQKVIQLADAVRVGLATPETVVTNDIARAEDFIRANRASGHRTIFKPLTPPLHQLGEARIVEDSIEPSALRLAPVILQRCIERGIDLRIVLVGERQFCAAIRFDSESEDWRTDPSARLEPYPIPPDLARRLRALQRELGLSVGSVDVRIDTGGVPYFLEINPSGQFLFVELELDMPISRAFAQLLLEDEPSRGAPRS